MTDPTVLVVAKAPVPGLAKTRVAEKIGDDAAAGWPPPRSSTR